MKSIIDVLIRRDGMTEEEANELLAEVKWQMEDCIAMGNYMEAEELFMSEVGLEPDYMMELFF